MPRLVKRIVLIGVAVAGIGALVLSMAGRGNDLPAANPAAAATTTATSAPSASAARQPDEATSKAMERYAELQRRVADDPRDAEALSELVDAMFQARAYGQAADLLTRAIDAGAESPRLRVGLGIALFYNGMPSLAQRELKKAIELYPDNIEAHFNYAVSLSHGSAAELQAAQASWQAVARLDPNGELGKKASDFLTQAQPVGTR